MDFSRHWLYVDKETQSALGNLHFLIAGVGIGSILAEIAVRMGVGHLVIADGDNIESHNLTRQNFTEADIGKNKALTLGQRLLSINPTADIRVIPKFLDSQSLQDEIPKADYVINTIDFECQDYITCSRLCRKYGKIELFPINFGFATVLAIFDEKSPTWEEFFSYDSPQELKMKITGHFASAEGIAPYLLQAQMKYVAMGNDRPDCDPQLAVSSYLTAALAMSRVFAILRGEKPQVFPEFYYLDAGCAAKQAKCRGKKIA